jgi:hypothetical protein
MQWLTADLIRMTILVNLILCTLGCLISALLGRWSRRSQVPRFLRATFATVLLSWSALFFGGGVGVLPTAFAFIIAARSNESPKPHELLVFALFICCFFAVFASFWFFSRLASGEKS